MGKKTRNREILAFLNGDNKKAILEYCCDKNLIQGAPFCENSTCKYYKTRKMSLLPRSATADGYSWRCTYCTSHKSIKANSFFEYFRSPIATILLLLHYWSLQTLTHETVAELAECTRQTVGSAYQRFRYICAKDNNKNKIKLGGAGRVVEIDESLFIRVKHHKGKDLKREQVWIFGMYERALEPVKEAKTKGRCLFFVVPKRDAVNLLNIIYANVEPGTTIISDCWKAYSRINKLPSNFTHMTVNHDLHFVCPVTGAHTNSVESIWCSVKVHMKSMRGVSRKFLSSYLGEFSIKFSSNTYIYIYIFILLDEYCFRRNNDLTKVGAYGYMIEKIAKMYVSSEIENLTADFEKVTCEQKKSQKNEKLYDCVSDDDGYATESEMLLPDGDLNDLGKEVSNEFLETNDSEEQEPLETIDSEERESQVTEILEERDSQVTENLEERDSQVTENLEEKDSQVTEILGEKDSQETENSRKFQFFLPDEHFERLVEEAFSKIVNGELDIYKFSSQLTIKQRESIHERAKKHNLSTKSQGTRYRVLYLFKDSAQASSLSSSQSQSTRQQASQSLQDESNKDVPRSQEVDAVISQDYGGENKVACPVCKKICQIGQGLRSHVSRMHKQEYKELKNKGEI